ncbi:hypothetical protein LLH00_01940 [bacterium]|nr:hypothetical protein [bacterium]
MPTGLTERAAPRCVRVLVWLVLLLLSAGTGAEGGAPAVLSGQGRILVLVSPGRAEYEVAARGFLDRIAGLRLDLSTEKRYLPEAPEQEKAFWKSLEGNRPRLIVTFGSPASFSALRSSADLPLVCSMLLDLPDPAASGASARDVTALVLRPTLTNQLGMIREALPAVRHVGMLYSPEEFPDGNPESTASGLGLRVIKAPVSSDRQVPEALRSIIDQVDILWLPPDNRVYNRDALRFILEECHRRSMPVVAFTRRLAEAGAALSLDFDYEDLGAQTADLALARLAAGAPAGRRVEAPRRLKLYINEAVAFGLGLHIEPQVLGEATLVGRERGRR